MGTEPDRARPRDPLIEEIRRVKDSVSAEVGHDVERLCRDLRREQEAGARRVIRRPRPAERGATGIGERS